jgi:eukaryotic-like serine/threonine-protein kinase
MSVSTGDRLGPYKIEDRLGAGGMGEVFRAQDTRLGRSVAVKVSAEQFTERFEREARVVASLNHPNICTLFDVGPNYLVMELVDGPTLADRLAEGQIPLEEALGLARQIAEALQAAHERGIVHRDLKPANIKLKPDGTVKVLDFGLATTGSATASGANSADSRTVLIGTTEAGMILGTAGYMAPEQARGKPVDKRADIWAYGVVVYEMLTGRKLFEGETVSDSLAAVLTKEPEFDEVPMKARRLVQSCLQKDPRKRLQDIGDAHLLLDDTPVVAGPQLPRRTRWLWPAGTAVLAAALLALVVLLLRRTPPPAEISRFQISVPEKVSLAQTGFALSPDGRAIAFEAIENGAQQVWIRRMDSLEAHALPGTIGTRPSAVFWSPDSRFVVFEANNKLKKINIDDGPAQNICDLPSSTNGMFGGSWSRDDVIIFGTTANGIMRVSAAGGTASPVTALDRSNQEIGHLYPSFLPDGNHFVYMRFPTGSRDAGVYVGSLDSKPEQQTAKPLFTGARASISWVASADSRSGRLLFWRDSVLYARTLNVRQLTFEGEARPIVDQVGYNDGPAFVLASASQSTLVYRRGAGEDLVLTWLDRNGKTLGAIGDPGRYSVLALSRDGTRAAVSKLDTGNLDLWLMDLISGVSTRFTFDPSAESSPVWSPDGNRVIFFSNRGGVSGFYEKSANGAGRESVLLQPAPGSTLTDWSRDGRYLIFHGNGAIWTLPLEGERKPFPFLRSTFNALGARLSPDGRFIAFRSTESGRDEIYVESFTPSPNAGSAASTGKWLVSRGGGSGMIHWRQDGKELYYMSLDGNVMAVPVTTSPAFNAGTPEPLFKVPAAFIRSAAPGTLGAVAPDGKRFLLALPKGGDARQEFTVVTNWDAAPKK